MAQTKGIRLNCERKIDHNTFNLKFGTTNKNNPLVIYIEGKTFITPNEISDNYSKDISAFKYELQRDIRKLLSKSKYFEGDFILDFQLANSGIKVGKKSFLTFEVLLKQPASKILKLNEVKEQTQGEICEIINSLEQNIVEHNFSISKTKK